MLISELTPCSPVGTKESYEGRSVFSPKAVISIVKSLKQNITSLREGLIGLQQLFRQTAFNEIVIGQVLIIDADVEPRMALVMQNHRYCM